MAKEITCGTLAGYKRHGRLKEPTCADCRAANNARQKEYYEANKQKIYEITRAWAARNPEKVKAYSRRMTAKRKSLKLSNGHTHYTEQEVLDKYGTNCHICKTPIDLFAQRQSSGDGWQKGLHLDHLIPLSKGGSDTLDNMRPAHALCNIKKRDR